MFILEIFILMLLAKPETRHLSCLALYENPWRFTNVLKNEIRKIPNFL